MRRLALGALALAVGLGASAAWADDARALSTAHIRKANALYEQKKFDAARAEYMAACDLVPSDKCFRGLAQTEFDSGRFLDAYRHLKRIEAHKGAVEAMTAEVRDDFIKLREAAFQRTGHVAVDAPANAPVSFDGTPQGVAPLADVIDTTPGEHIVEANVNGTPVKITVVALAGSIVPAHLVAAPAAPPPPAVSPTPVVPASAPPSPPIEAPSDRSPSGGSARLPLAVAALGVGVVGLGLGIGFRLEAQSKASDLTALQDQQMGACANPGSALCSQAHTLSSEIDRDTTISTVGYVVAGVGVAGAAALWFLWPKTSTQAAWIFPSVGAGGAELNVGGRF